MKNLLQLRKKKNDINQNLFEANPAISAGETETENSETQSNFSSIQLSNSNTEDRPNMIDSENLPQTQQEPKTQEIQNSSQKSQSSIQAKPATNSQKSRDFVPESWSNIEELMGETEKPEPDFNRKRSPNINPEESRLKKPPKSQLLPDSTQVSAKGEVRSSQFENQPSQIKKLMQKTLANRGKLKEKVSGRKGHQVQPLNEQDLYALEENVNAQNIAQVQQQDESKEEVITSENLEELAREIYGAICQRFQVERERYGSSNFSNRLPW